MRVCPLTLFVFAILLVPAASQERTIRNISPGVTAPQRPGSWIDYERLQQSALPARAPPPRKITVAPDGQLKIDGQFYALEGAAPIKKNRICETPAGQKWACGLRAYIAWRNYFRSPVVCDLRSRNARCARGDEESDVWLLTNGWADLLPGETDERRIAAFQSAQERQVGTFSDVP